MRKIIAELIERNHAAGHDGCIESGQAITYGGPLEERYCRAFHPEVESVPLMPIEVARATAASTGNQMLGFFAELMAYFEKASELGDPTEANELLGAPSITLDTWIAQRQNGS